jgi:hypothetical protein
MEGINSTTSVGSRRRLSDVSVRIFFQKSASEYRCCGPLGCRKVLTRTFPEISMPQRGLPAMLVAPRTPLLVLS